MKAGSFTTRLIQLATYLPYFLPDRPGQLVTSLPDDDIKVYTTQCQMHIKRKWQNRDITTLMVLSILWYNFSRQGLKIQKNQSHQVFPQETTRKARKALRKGNWSLLIILRKKMWTKIMKTKICTKFMVHADLSQMNP